MPPANMEFSNVNFSFINDVIFTICSKITCIYEILKFRQDVRKINESAFFGFHRIQYVRKSTRRPQKAVLSRDSRAVLRAF